MPLRKSLVLYVATCHYLLRRWRVGRYLYIGMPTRPRILSIPPRIVRASSSAAARAPAWRRVFQSAIRDLATLCDRLEIPLPQGFTEASEAAKQFPVMVPEPYLRRIKKGDLSDPLLLQVLASSLEMATPAGFSERAVTDATKGA
jgi:L-lysine 2,3-aminomutase